MTFFYVHVHCMCVCAKNSKPVINGVFSLFVFCSLYSLVNSMIFYTLKIGLLFLKFCFLFWTFSR